MKTLKRIVITMASIVVLLVLAFVIYFTTHSKLNGIFEIRLGMTEAELKAVIDTSKLELDNFVFDSIDKSHFPDGTLKGYYLKEYIVEDDYIIKGVQIALYNDKIYQIILLNLDYRTQALLDEKYRRREVKTYLREVRGDKPKLNAKGIEWHTYDFDVKCISILYYLFSKPSTHYLYIIDLETSKEVKKRDGQDKIKGQSHSLIERL